MKKIIAILIIFIAFSSCKKLEDYNKNIKDPAAVAGESLFTNAQKNLFEEMVNSNVNFNDWRLIMQYWCETTYIDESNYDLDTRSIPDNHWDRLYRDVLKDLSESSKIIKATVLLPSEDPIVKANKLLIIDIMSVYTYSILVETFGNIPYSGAMDNSLSSSALNLNIPLPKYDDGLKIYKDLINRLNKDIVELDNNSGSFGNYDNMYHGDVTSWIKFANSLKLRMGMLLSDIPNEQVFAKTIVEEAAPNVFNSNADNAKIIYQLNQPNTNPIYVDLVASGRNDFVPTSVIVDTMNALNDPRRPFYFTLLDGVYVGGENGASNDFTASSHVADKIQEPTFEGILFDYSEVEFLLAEGIERGYAISGSAESHYNNAIKASIKYWAAVSQSTIDAEAAANDYLANPKVAYQTAAGDYKQKIGTQQWIAYYNRGFEAWTEWRRLDFPKLVAPPDALSAFPLRYTYPIEEQTLNGANYKSASSAIGGDAVDTKLFFDIY
jgi:hypothetical protein